jgi:hypothetical protein
MRCLLYAAFSVARFAPVLLQQLQVLAALQVQRAGDQHCWQHAVRQMRLVSKQILMI